MKRLIPICWIERFSADDHYNSLGISVGKRVQLLIIHFEYFLYPVFGLWREKARSTVFTPFSTVFIHSFGTDALKLSHLNMNNLILKQVE